VWSIESDKTGVHGFHCEMAMVVKFQSYLGIIGTAEKGGNSKWMDSDYKPSESDVKMVMEVHGLLPEGPLLDGALGLTALYANSPHRLVGEYTKKGGRKE